MGKQNKGKVLKNKDKGKDKEKGKNKITIILTIIILLLLFIIIYLAFIRERTVTITFNTDGGSAISAIEVKNGEIVELPEAPKKEGYKFVGWSNKEGNIVTKGTKVKKNITLKAEWISNDAKTITAQFDTTGGNLIDNIIIEKGKIILLPINPTREGYTFIGWVDSNGNIVTSNMVVNSNVILKAIWVSNDAETVKLNFDTDGGNVIKGLIFEKGKGILLPIAPTKTGYVFSGWVDGNGNPIAKDTIITSNMTIKALWKAYSCPAECTPIGDGSKCTKEKTTAMVNKTSCPSGTILYNTWYGSGKFCIKLSTKVDANIRQCDTWDAAEVIYKDSNGKMWCVKTVKKTTTKGCPSGYTKDGNTCKKTETLNCTLK